jgi:type IV secretion system protein VirB11
MATAPANLWLETCLAPLAPLLAGADVTDLYVNRPGEVWVERLGGAPERHDAPELTGQLLARLARQIAAVAAQGVSREHPLLAASLPSGERVQIIMPPATRGDLALAIRKHVSAGLGLADYAEAGNFDEVDVGDPPGAQPEPVGGNISTIARLRAAVRNRRNILVSGGTSSGKTTFLNALLREIPPGERLIAIEDTPELQLHHPNSVGLLAVRGAMGEARVSPEDLLIASLRMRPDRIILGEVRGGEAMTFLRAINTGHPGSLSTIHADTPQGAIDQLVMLALQAGSRMRWEDIERYVRRTVHLIVQLDRSGGHRRIAGIVRPADLPPAGDA